MTPDDLTVATSLCCCLLQPGDEIVFIDSYKCDQIETSAAVAHLQGCRIRKLTVKRPQRVYQL